MGKYSSYYPELVNNALNLMIIQEKNKSLKLPVSELPKFYGKIKH